MITIVEHVGDLFAAPDKAIGHGCNGLGYMNTGVADQVRRRYPNTYQTYRGYCHAGLFHCSVLPLYENGKWVFNMHTQHYPGPHATLYRIRKALSRTIELCPSLGLRSIAIPRLGCGIGGLDWPEVLETITSAADEYEYWWDHDLVINIYRLED